MRFVHLRSGRAVAGMLVVALTSAGCGAPQPGGNATTTQATSAPTTADARRPFVPPDCSVPRDPPTPTQGDRIGPLLVVGPRTYLARGVELPVSSAGAVVGRTCRQDAGGTIELLDGDSPYPPGTELRAVAGYDPGFRLGVVVDDRLAVFELFYDGTARTGADLYDLTSGVDAIEIRSLETDELITTWTDDRVQTVVDAIGPAPIDRGAGDGLFTYRLQFRLRDGTSVDAPFDARTGRLQDLRLGPDVAALFDGLPRPTAPVPTTAPAVDPPPTSAPIGPVPIDRVRVVADALGVRGDVEEMPGEFGPSHCIGRLASPGLCVDGPAWGTWQYWDVDAQSLPSATEDEARAAAVGLLTRLGLPAGLGAIGSNGAQISVALEVGGTVVVAEGGRIAQVIAPSSMLKV